jgi:hypothetical protein
MFRIIQTSVVLAITLVMVNESQAGRPGTSSANGVSQPKTPPTQNTLPPGAVVNNKTHIPNTRLLVPITKDPVHGTGSSHDPRSPSNTHHRDYCGWSHHCWNSRYGCETYFSVADGCFFYFYAPASCYYPIVVIEQFPPVRTPVAPIAAAPTVAVVPAIQITNVNRNTLVNGAAVPVEAVASR